MVPDCDGDCVFNPDIPFQLGISSGDISGDPPDLEKSTSTWDDCCGDWTMPDAEVHIVWDVAGCDGTSVASQADICSGQSADTKDTFTPTWQYDAGWVSAGEITTTFCLSIVD